ncbi:MAG: phage tail protein [Anaerovibrio sp.]|uniref:phage tail tube protein n=1 Tax=Anaerovibrio sp. TaxID=1872532 RepID=UPI001B2C8F04|nr:phage tail tube protein [Anaerovibrio sp.]MBO6247094.1 phage tail protein [Anaerovibrio sp.]
MAITATDLANLPQNPDTAVAEAGKDTLLSILTALDGTTETWTLVGGQRNSPVAETANTIDASHKTSGGWATSVPGLKSWSINYSGLMIMSDDGLKVLDYAFRNDHQIKVKITYKDGSYQTGWCYVTAFNNDTAHDGVATISATLSGVGAISAITPAETTTPADPGTGD